MQLFANNAVSTLAADVAAGATSIVLKTGDGALFPSPSSPDFFYLTLSQAATESSWEIVKVTTRSSDTLTVVRGQQGTVAAAWSTGDKAELRVTAGSHPALVHAANHKSSGSDPLSYNDLADLPTLGTAASHPATDFLASSATTSNIPEGSNLYFTNARAIGATLTGFTAATSSSAITSSDSGLTALQKVEYRLALDDAKVTFPGFGTTSSTACAGNDSRLSDARTPTSHTLISHTASGLTGGQLLLATGATTYAWTTITGDVTFNSSGAASISAATVTGKLLTGLSTASGGTISASDSILAAFGKAENRMALNDAKTSFPGYYAGTPSALGTAAAGTGLPAHGDHVHALPKVTLTYSWAWETAVTTADWQPCYLVRAASTLIAIRAYQDSGTSSFTASVVTIYKNGSSWKTINLPASWTSGTRLDISTGLSDALAVGDYLTAAVTTAGTHAKVTLTLEVEQVAHA